MTIININKIKNNTYSDFSWSDFLNRIILIALSFVVLSLILILKSRTADSFVSHPGLMIYTILVTCFELSRIFGAILFKYVDEKINEKACLLEKSDNKIYEPTVSFIVPCKNEEKVIERTVEKCYGVDYPLAKLEVIVINDGSTDNTLSILRKCQKKIPNLIVINWRKNKGKRYGMAAGIKRAKGEIVIQLDSDSYIEKNSFRNMIKPFRNPEIGAVCAHADPENADKNLLTKMQAAYYFMSFRILKAAESSFLTVLCCSGCSSAYRKKIILPIIDKWLKEEFLGKLVTWGDDRALTNWVIKLGYKTIYSDRAQAYTICPASLKQFVKQQIRWKKGWFVNSIFASKFMLKDHPFIALTYFFPLLFITLITPYMAIRALIINPIFLNTSPVYYMTGVMLVSALIMMYYRYVNKSKKYWPYIIVLQSFILIYALITIQDRRWGTR